MKSLRSVICLIKERKAGDRELLPQATSNSLSLMKSVRLKKRCTSDKDLKVQKVTR